MPRPTSFDRMCCPRVVMSCHARRRPTVCWPMAAMSYHALRCRLAVLSKGGDVMPRPMSFDRACRPRAVMSCHARRRSTVCAIQRQRCHATSDVVPPCVVPKGDDGMARLTSFDRLCCLKVVMSCHALRRTTVCIVQGQ